LLQEAVEPFTSVVERLVTQIFIWFGVYLFENSIEQSQADDSEFVDSFPPTHALMLTDMGIKFYLNIFFILFRLLFLQRHAVAVPKVETGTHPFAVETFHVEASVDDFHMLGMYIDIPPGCLLEYKHSYSGFYNNVSQCVYRHFPSYQRRTPVSLADVVMPDASDLAALPSLKQIYPEIDYAFEDHHFQREVGGVREAVLLAYRRPATPVQCTEGVSGTTSCRPSVPLEADVPNEQMQARIAACMGAGASSSSGVEGGKSVRIADWFWFVIGSTVYLVCTSDGVPYSGCCRDLLAFYIDRRT
jgi:hypothetical protein